MSTSQKQARPLSPHLSIYRWQISNTLSILHRITGFGLAIGMVLLVAWLVTAAWFPAGFEQLQSLLGSIVGKLFLFGWTVAFYYHLGNGLRHLNWDMGHGLKLDEMTASGRVVVVFAISMAIFTWTIAAQKGAL